MRAWVSALLSLCVAASGVAALAWATDGWTTWTAEAARRQALLRRQTPLPDVGVQSENGTVSSLHEFDKPLLVVDFIFTRCTDACMVMGYRFSRLQALLAQTDQAENVQLLSISFDHEHDGPEQLSAYLHRFSAEPGLWSALRVIDKQALEQLLDSLGVIVLPEPELGYVHNTAFYLFRNRELAGVYDVDDTATMVRRITAG